MCPQLAATAETLASDLATAQEVAEKARTRKAELVAAAKVRPACRLWLMSHDILVPCMSARRVLCVAQALEHEIANFSKERDKRIKAAQDKLKKAKVSHDLQDCNSWYHPVNPAFHAITCGL